MANANAIVEKLAGVGLRHGEKAGVAIAMMVFLLCVGIAVSQPTITTSPEKVKAAAQASSSNLSRPEDRETIIKRLEEKESIKPTDFAGKVEAQIKAKIDPVAYTPKRGLVTPEPGAGLIRDKPKLVAPTDLYAYPGRGGLLVYAVDEEGKKIKLKEGEEQEKRPQKYGNTKPRRTAGMGGGMGGMMGGGQRKKKGISKEEAARQAKAERDMETRKIKGAVVGEIDASKKKDAADDKDDEGPFKETTRGYRWVAITGILDHGQMLAYYKEALKNPAVAHPQYLRLDLQRRTLQDDGTWTAWKDVDQGKNLDILDELPANEEELAPVNVLPEGLVDPLPFLNAGLWEKVHIASLIPSEKLALPEEPKAEAGMGQGMGGMQGMMRQQQQQQQNMGAMQQSMMKNQTSAMQGTGSMMSRMGGMGGSLGSTESAGNFWKSEEKRVMIRALDFTADPGHSYRYRVRIVVVNPNYHRDDVSAGTNKDSRELTGPWSKETDIVTMPPDVEAYSVGQMPPGGMSGTRVRFQVVRFNTTDGWTIPHPFDAGVGEVIGDPRTEKVPRSDGTGQKSELVDFSTHEIVLDVAGGGYQNLPSGMQGPPIERPVMAMLLRRDGSVVVHSQVDDLIDEVRKDIQANYFHELELSSKKRKNSRGAGMGGMMGGMNSGGMMGGGMMGGGMMGGGRR